MTMRKRLPLSLAKNNSESPTSAGLEGSNLALSKSKEVLSDTDDDMS